MINKEKRLIIEDQQNDFLYKKSKSNLDIRFNRIAFIFFIFFIISLIYSIHLMHLGSRKSNIEARTNYKQPLSNLYRADIVDRNNKYLVKTVSSVDVGISPLKITYEKKLIFKLRYIFPNENYVEIKKKIKKGNFFYFKRKVSNENY